MSTDRSIRVWDLAVRLFHWTLVTLFVIAYLTGEELGTLHGYAGYGIAALLGFRLLWGFVGSRHARFGDFLYGPAAVLRYLRSLLSGRPEHYLGHNPAGGWMIFALLISLALTCWSGLEAYAVEGHGPLAGGPPTIVATAYADGHDDDDGHGKGGEKDELWEELHEAFANFTLFLVGLHILGVVVSSRLHGENLVRAMIDGHKGSEGRG